MSIKKPTKPPAPAKDRGVHTASPTSLPESAVADAYNQMTAADMETDRKLGAGMASQEAQKSAHEKASHLIGASMHCPLCGRHA